MSLNIGCLVRKFDWKSKWRSSNPVQWVEQQGFTAVSAPLTEAYPDYFQDANQMVVYRGSIVVIKKLLHLSKSFLFPTIAYI
jgi:hypothetical protein